MQTGRSTNFHSDQGTLGDLPIPQRSVPSGHLIHHHVLSFGITLSLSPNHLLNFGPVDRTVGRPGKTPAAVQVPFAPMLGHIDGTDWGIWVIHGGGEKQLEVLFKSIERAIGGRRWSKSTTVFSSFDALSDVLTDVTFVSMLSMFEGMSPTLQMKSALLCLCMCVQVSCS